MEEFFDEDIREELNAEQEATVKEAEQLRNKIRSVLKDSEDGREVADYIIKELCAAESTCFRSDALEMARAAGKQEVGMILRQILE